MNLTNLASFVRVAELGTITAAAEAEGVKKSTISRRIARLEETLGVQLLRRSARLFTLTDDGRALQAHASGALRELERLERTFTGISGVPCGRLTITAPPDMARAVLVPQLLATYRRRYPEVHVDICLESRVVDLVAEGFDIGIRASTERIPGGAELMMRALGAPPVAFYASPDYIERLGGAATPEELVEHDMVMHSAAESRTITLRSQVGAAYELELPTPVIQANDFLLIQSLVERGVAIGLLPMPNARDAEQNGTLVRVLPELSARLGHVSLVWPSSRQLAPRVRAFIDLATELLSLDEVV